MLPLPPALLDEDGSAHGPAVLLLTLLAVLLAQSTTAQVQGFMDRAWDRMEEQLVHLPPPAGFAGQRPGL
ncbi:hypothetical protein [Rubellimicrobium roseum]|uniref:Uncharacterized protein n=1 Tax=Rubellimicrobium roseum TaxID=687525 RepID=A0A5C4NGI3_9RHOB|nr:hypothetical protein [Rubellimicrobium roseum]TNC72975.1 hypothetical protein FHG71_06655 [Rubellimicrobium roseum]